MVFVLWPRADVSAQRVLEVLDTDPIVKTGTKTAADVARLGGGKTGTVEFRNVSFTYPGSREATLEGIDFTAEKGQTVAFRLRQVQPHQPRAALLRRVGRAGARRRCGRARIRSESPS